MELYCKLTEKKSKYGVTCDGPVFKSIDVASVLKACPKFGLSEDMQRCASPTNGTGARGNDSSVAPASGKDP